VRIEHTTETADRADRRPPHTAFIHSVPATSSGAHAAPGQASHQHGPAVDDQRLARTERLAHQVEIRRRHVLRLADAPDGERRRSLAIQDGAVRLAQGIQSGVRTTPGQTALTPTGQPFGWELRRGEEVVAVPVSGRFTVNEPIGLLDACLNGHGVAQPLECYARELIADGRLVQLLPDWADERFPAYAYHRARKLPSAKVRAFLDFVVALTRERAG
jgi:DNA-binding transcriptional LysR family regulator